MRISCNGPAGLAAQLILLSCSYTTGSLGKRDFGTSWHYRVRRLDGYVYSKPNVPFDLPNRPSVTSQAPPVDRTQAQRMYYAYPAPAEGTVNIGYSSTATNTAAGGNEGGYNYKQAGGSSGSSGIATGGYGGANLGSSSQSGGTSGGYGGSGGGYESGRGGASDGSSKTGSGGGYNYEGPTTVAVTSSTSGSTAETVGSSGSVTVGGESKGYNYPSPAPTSKTSIECANDLQPSCGTIGASTNAPKYLPPQGESPGTVPSSAPVPSLATPSGPTIAVPLGTSPIPSADVYLPPALPSVSVPETASTAYLPPSSPAIQTSISSNPRGPDSVPSQDYLPPAIGIGVSSPGSVPTPAVTYLPPVL